ncbi:MAG: metallophosphoesterase [Lachnospiraceae bacterium]|nr:metallophosphoesterase [Lachnospiraceae bacterium]
MKTSDCLNYKWVYTYDYAPDSVWEPWRESAAPSAWIPEEADRAAARTKRGLLSFLLLADSHFTYNGTREDTAASMKALGERIPLSGIIHLGDLTDGLLPLAQTEEIERRCMADMERLGFPVYVTPGNHDYNYFRDNPEIRYPERLQYFVDMPGYKLRLIFIDSFDPKERLRYGFSDYCIHWLDVCFNRMPEGYLAIVFSHVPPLVRLQAWTDNIRNREKLITVLDKYADRILAFINGHNHCDLLFNDLHNGQFPVISINCAKCEYFTEHKPDGAVVPYRRLGDRIQESFDIMQVDAEKRQIYFVRFGAGKDRIVTDHKAFWV